MDNDTSIRVDMIIDKAIFPYIKKNAVATISSDGLVGNMIINIIPGKGNEPSVQPGDEIRTYNRVRTEDLLICLMPPYSVHILNQVWHQIDKQCQY